SICPHRISIHPLLAERDQRNRRDGTKIRKFQSTLSSRRGTGERAGGCACQHISIHPLLAERDPRLPLLCEPARNFNPPSPRGEGQKTLFHCGFALQFQSTLSSRRGT